MESGKFHGEKGYELEPPPNYEGEGNDDEKKNESKTRRCLRYVFGDTLEEIFCAIRKIIWAIAVVVCCFFMVSQVRHLCVL